MKWLSKSLYRLLVAEDGPTAVEYAVMVALIIIVCLGTIQALGLKVMNEFNNVSTSLT
jgi:pilus assembly protein Flp/PilA